MPMNRKWWKETVIYQVYPRSFKDSDGNGVGDLKGILSKLDYISSLGVDTIWLNPIYASPGEDNGYDISDYRAVDPQYGTMDDLQRLIDELHGRKMRVIMDMVVNHTSDQHEWFRSARQSREDPHYAWYHWWPAEKGEPPYRCGFFDPKGKAWEFNAATNSYYLHYFSPRQPDLNWENAELRGQIYEMLRFWLAKGVDGFRMDAITFISKDPRWPEITAETLKEKFDGDWGNYYASGPKLHEYLREMRAAVVDGDAIIIGESSGVSAEKAPELVAEDRKELNMIYQFEGIMIGYLPGEFKKVDPKGWSLVKFKDVYTRWDGALEGKGWNTLYLGNHDQPRMVSRWGDDSDEFRAVSAKLLFTFLLTMRGTPSLYNGDELGMTNIRFERIDDYQDIETREKYEQVRQNGGDTEGFLKDQQLAARDNSRTPFQWNGGPHAGFTDGEPWIAINANHRVINVAAQEGDQESVLAYVRQLVRLRRERKVLVYGEYRLLDPDDAQVYAYERWDERERVLVLLNFSGRERVYGCGEKGKVLVNNYRELLSDEGGVRLQPWQAVVIAV
ncbi:MAG TPA: alpha-glucosidase [Puia sp.]|nr:alpha-glucosidase [Puia sp.]